MNTDKNAAAETAIRNFVENLLTEAVERFGDEAPEKLMALMAVR